MSVNKVMLLGHLGGDPKLKEFNNGGKVCEFSLATNESYTNKSTGELVEKVEWHKIIVQGKAAEHCAKYLAKGRQVFVEGKNQTRSYDDDNGVKRYITEVVSFSVQFIGGSKAATEETEVGSHAPQSQTEYSGEDIPF